MAEDNSTNNELNIKLSEIADAGELYPVRGLENTGKALPYLGWYWRSVAPDYIKLGFTDGYVWIMQKNKWDYPYVEISEAQRADIYRRLLDIAQSPTPEKCQDFFDFLQTFAEDSSKAKPDAS